MNELVAAIYRRDEYSFIRWLQDPRYQEKTRLNEALRVVLGDDMELEIHDKMKYSEMLLCAGASPNIRNWNNDPVVYYACQNQDMAVLELLSNFAPDMNQANEEYKTALHVAAELGHPAMVGILLSCGADANVQDEFGNSPLMLALPQQDLEVIKLLLIDSDVNLPNIDKEVPIIISALHGRKDQMRLLIENGAEVNGQDIHQETALMMAAMRGDHDAAKVLIDAGGDVNIVNIDRQGCLHKAAGAPGPDVGKLVRLLITSGADIDVRSVYGNTPLFVAISVGNHEATRELLQANCNVNTRGNFVDGKVCSALELAILKDDLRMIIMLLSAGCTYTKQQVDQAVAHVMLTRMSAQEPPRDDDVFNGHLKMITHLTSPPLPLQQLCRLQIRKCLNHGITDKLGHLMLPAKITDYLAIKELEYL